MAKAKRTKVASGAKPALKRRGSARPDLERALHELIKRRAPALRELEKH